MFSEQSQNVNLNNVILITFWKSSENIINIPRTSRKHVQNNVLLMLWDN